MPRMAMLILLAVGTKCSSGFSSELNLSPTNTNLVPQG